MAKREQDQTSPTEGTSMNDDDMVRGRSDDVDDIANDSADEFEDSEDLEEEEDGEEGEGSF